MHLIALTDEQRAELQSALHYLLIKGGLKQLSGEININPEFFTNLRAVQDQVVNPKKVICGLNETKTHWEVKSVVVDTNQILLRPF